MENLFEGRHPSGEDQGTGPCAGSRPRAARRTRSSGSPRARVRTRRREGRAAERDAALAAAIRDGLEERLELPARRARCVALWRRISGSSIQSWNFTPSQPMSVARSTKRSARSVALVVRHFRDELRRGRTDLLLRGSAGQPVHFDLNMDFVSTGCRLPRRLQASEAVVCGVRRVPGSEESHGFVLEAPSGAWYRVCSFEAWTRVLRSGEA